MSAFRRKRREERTRTAAPSSDGSEKPSGTAPAEGGLAELAPAEVQPAEVEPAKAAPSETVPSEASPREAGPDAPPEVAVPIEIESAGDETAAIPVAPEGQPAEIVEATRPKRHRLATSVFLLGIALAAFVTGLFVFNNMVMPRLIHSAGEVRVPELVNLTLEQAEQTLQPLGLTLSRAGERFDPSVPRGFILSQDPEPETPVRGKKRVLVVVSLGEEFSSVPALFGESVRGARYLLERAGLRVGRVTRAPSEEVGAGLVAGSDPPAETVLPRDAPVGLLVSSGVREENFVMPDVLGREIGGVRRQFESLGFRVFTPPAAPSVGVIVFQDPAPGSRITRATTILIQATGRIIR